jgi:hypothetical protein
MGRAASPRRSDGGVAEPAVAGGVAEPAVAGGVADAAVDGALVVPVDATGARAHDAPPSATAVSAASRRIGVAQRAR